MKKTTCMLALAGAVMSNTIFASDMSFDKSELKINPVTPQLIGDTSSSKPKFNYRDYRQSRTAKAIQSSFVQTLFHPTQAKKSTPAINRNASQMFASDAALNITDANLQNCINNQISMSGITYASELTQIFCGSLSISDLTGIDAFSGLTFVDLGFNQIADATPLANLPLLNTLYIWENQIADVSPLATIATLSELDIAFNPATDLSAFANNSNLSMFFLGGNGTAFDDVTPISSMTGLSTLGIFDSQLTSLDFAANLTQLQMLDVYRNPITDISAITNLTNLSDFYLMETAIKDVSPLVANLVNFQHLALMGSEGVYCWQQDYIVNNFTGMMFDPAMSCDASTDFDDYDLDGTSNRVELDSGTNPFGDGTPPPPPPAMLFNDALMMIADQGLASCLSTINGNGDYIYANELTELSCPNHGITQVYGIEVFSELTQINLALNAITDLQPFNSLQQLKNLDLMSNGLIDISDLAYNNALETLNLVDNQISQIAPLQDLIQLRNLSLAANPIADFSPIAQMAGLKFIDLADTPLNDLNILTSLLGLEYVDVTGTPIVDITGINSLVLLHTLQMAYTPIADVSPALMLSDTWEWLSVGEHTYCWQVDYIEQRMTVTSGFNRPLNCDNSDEFGDFDNDGITNQDELAFGTDPLTQDLPQVTYHEALMMVIDGSLRNCLLNANVMGLVYADELTSLTCQNQGVTDLTGIEQFRGLTYLNLDGNAITDVTPLNALVSLETLSLNGNFIFWVAPLDALTQLKDLFLIGNNVSDIETLAPLVNLLQLSLAGNIQVADISALANFTQLRMLDVRDTQVSNVSLIANMPELVSLDVSFSFVTDLSPIAGRTNLVYLYAEGLANVDLKPVIDLNNNWQDLLLSTLSYCWQLDHIDNQLAFNNYVRPHICENNDDFNDYDSDGVINIDEVFAMTDPFVADVPVTPITIADALLNVMDTDLVNCIQSSHGIDLNAAADTLDMIACPMMNIQSLDGIEAFTGVTLLDVYQNQLTDVSQVSALTNLTTLFVDGNEISDISFLHQLTNLTVFAVDSSILADISIFFSLPNLWENIMVGPASFCWQADYIANYVSVTHFMAPMSCDNSDDLNDYDGDGVNNRQELNDGTNPII